MRRIVWIVSMLALALAGCGGDGSAFDRFADSTSSTGSPGSSITTTTAGGGDSGDEGSDPDIPPPHPSAIIQTAAWGEVYDRRLVVALADGADPAAPDQVAAAVGGTLAARLDEYLIVEVELPTGGEAALADGLEILASHPTVLVAAPSGVYRPGREVAQAPCGPLDSLVLQAEDRGDQYSLIGVEDAWRLVRASGVTPDRPTIGIVDGFGASIDYHGSWVNQVVHSTAAGEPPGVFDAIMGEDAVTVVAREVFGEADATSTTAWMAGARRVIAQGATVVNLSLGSTGSPEQHALVRRWLQLMEVAHPEVLFVASAGNAGGDVADHYPGGISRPNLVTVGGLDHQGQPAGFSNYMTGEGEVTLGVLADDVYTGMSSDGAPVVLDGTSFAAPQVTAAVAVLQALDPTLTGSEVKQILVDTAATEIANPDISDRVLEVDPGLGGRALRLDNAVWKVLTERRGITGTREELLGRATLNARVRPADDDPLTYVIRGVAPGGANATTVRIAVDGPGVLNPGTESLPTQDDVARWRWSFLEFDQSARVTLTRTDTGACARVVITADQPWAGGYEGTFEWSNLTAGWATFNIPQEIDWAAAAVPFTLAVTDENICAGAIEWTGTFDYMGANTFTLEGSCSGTVDAEGTMRCDGEFIGTLATSLGLPMSNPGTFTINARVDPDGNVQGTITFRSNEGDSAALNLTGTRIGE